MPIRFRCGSCDAVLSIGRRKAGAVIHCPKCRRQVMVPAPPGDVKDGHPVSPPVAPDAPLPPAPVPATAAVEFAPPRRVRRPAYELILSLAAILIITAAYAYLAQSGVPKPGGPLGHGLGVVGFLMMLGTETLYSLRKRLRGFALGRLSVWLQVHIFTGIVGPFLVLLHSAGKFNGVAGVLTLLTVVVVVSGLIGRYIYTAVPRTLDGVEVAVQELEYQIADADRELQALGGDPLGKEALALAAEAPRHGWMLVLGRPFLRWRQQWSVRRMLLPLSAADPARAARLRRLLAERYRLQLQIHSLAGTRRLLALWHVFHVPLGVAVFTLAAVHIGAALYFATFLR
jgi:hypothetical protein